MLTTCRVSIAKGWRRRDGEREWAHMARRREPEGGGHGAYVELMMLRRGTWCPVVNVAIWLRCLLLTFCDVVVGWSRTLWCLSKGVPLAACRTVVLFAFSNEDCSHNILRGYGGMPGPGPISRSAGWYIVHAYVSIACINHSSPSGGVVVGMFDWLGK